MAKTGRKKSEAEPRDTRGVCETCGAPLAGREPEPEATGAEPAVKRAKAATKKCLKGKSDVDAADAQYVCEKCGARTDDANHVCKPKKVKKKEKDEKKDKKKEEKKAKKKERKKEGKTGKKGEKKGKKK